MPTLHRARWIVYLNGIEVPAQSATVQIANSMIPVATVVLAPDRELLRLGREDRVQVTIFYLDDIQTRNENKPPDYRLLFEGEVTAWGYQQSAMGRNISFQAAGYAAVLQQMTPNLITNIESLSGATAAAQAGAVHAIEPIYPSSFLYYGLKKDAGPIKRPFDYIENIFRALFGAAEFRAPPNVPNKNPPILSSPAGFFFARWARRTNFLNRWAPSPFLETVDLERQRGGVFPILQALKDTSVLDALNIVSLELGGGGSLWDLVQTIFQLAYYDISVLPNMPLVSYRVADNTVMPPPKYDRETAEEKAARALIATAAADLEKIKQTRASQTEVAEAVQALQDAKDAYTDAVRNAKSKAYGRGPEDPLIPLRILSHVTKPQLQYCAVPRCNIIFPSMVTDYMFNEDFRSQPTRLYLHDVTRNSLIQGKAAPLTLIKDLLRTGFPIRVRNFIKKSNNTDGYFSDKNFVAFPEEYYKGPVVMTRNYPPWFMHLANSLANSADTIAKQSKVNTDTSWHDAARGVIDTYAEYEYTKERGAARTGAVNLIFNPYVAPGFPAVVLDREDTNVHVFCYVQNVTHSLTSGSMSTSINYSFAQTFEEFFQTMIEQQNELQGVALPSSLIAKAKADAQKAQIHLALLKTSPDRDAVALANAEKDLTAAYRALAAAQSFGLGVVYTALAEAYDTLEKAKTDYSVTEKAQLEAQATVTKLEESLSNTSGVYEHPHMVPAHPVPDIRNRFQNFDNAAEYYAALFQQNQKDFGRSAVFRWDEMLGVLDAFDRDKPAEKIKIEPAETVSILNEDGTTTTQRIVRSNAVGRACNVYGLREPFRVLANDTDQAMMYIARPICSLEEYIDFNGTRGIRYDPVIEADGAFFYAKILDLTPGPGVQPPEDDFGNPTLAVHEDTRLDWESRLLRYRAKMRSNSGIFRA